MAKNVSGSATYGQTGGQMLRHLRRAAWLPQYDTDGVRSVIEEIKELYSNIHKTLTAAKGMDTHKPEAASISCSVIVHHHALLRNKRILCAYHRYRMNVVEDQRWEKGAILTEFHRNKLNSSEMQYFEGYNKLLSAYMANIDVDFTSNLTPPKELKCEITVLENVGNVETANCSYNFSANTTHFVNSSDVETLIRTGKVVRTKH